MAPSRELENCGRVFFFSSLFDQTTHCLLFERVCADVVLAALRVCHRHGRQMLGKRHFFIAGRGVRFVCFS